MIGIEKSTLTIIVAVIVLLLTSLLISGCMDASDRSNGDAQNQLDSDTSEQTDDPETLFPEGMLEGLQKNGFLIESLDEIACDVTESGDHYIRYYGTYNGYIIIFAKSNATAIGEMNIAGKLFLCSNLFHIYAYRDGELYKLQDVYNDGLLSDENIAEIYEIHKRFEFRDRRWWHPSEISFPEEMLEGLQKNGFLIESLDEISCEIDPLSKTRYYGMYHEYIILFSAGEMRVNTEITVAGETFFHGDCFNIYAYKDGELYTLQEAYEKGILNEEDIKDIAEYHRQFEDDMCKISEELYE